MTNSVFNAYSLYYDLLYADKDYAAEVAYVRSLLIKHGITHGDLLEFGSGTGKHGCLLANLGYRVHGIERSPDMVLQAHSGEGFSCEQGDICAVHMGRKYNAVLSLFHVISYQTNNVNVQAVFSRAAEHLEQGGIFLFDFWYSPAVYTQQPSVRIKRMENEHFHITRIAEPVIYPNENRVDVNYTIFVCDKTNGETQTLRETHPMRHFSLPEIDLFAQLSGFERIGAEEFLTGKQPDHLSWGVCTALRRI